MPPELHLIRIAKSQKVCAIFNIHQLCPDFDFHFFSAHFVHRLECLSWFRRRIILFYWMAMHAMDFSELKTIDEVLNEFGAYFNRSTLTLMTNSTFICIRQRDYNFTTSYIEKFIARRCCNLLLLLVFRFRSWLMRTYVCVFFMHCLRVVVGMLHLKLTTENERKNRVHKSKKVLLLF